MTDLQNFRIIRLANELTIADVARICETSKKTVYRFEHGGYKKETEAIKRLKEFYSRIDPVEILTHSI